MAGVDANIPLQVKPINATGRISDLLQLKGQMANVRTAEAGAAGAEQTQKQRKALADFDITKIIGDDGTIDLNKIPDSGLREAAGDQFPDMLSKYAAIKQQQLAAKQSLVQLRDVQRSSFGEMLGALRSDPDVANDTPEGRQKVSEAFGQFAEIHGEDAVPVLKAYASPLKSAPQGKLAQVIQNIQLQATSASDQASRQAPQFTNTGSEVKQTNPYAQKGQAPDSIPLTLSPGEQETIVEDQQGNKYGLRRDSKGNIVGTRAIASAGGDADKLPRFAPGEQLAYETALGKQTGANAESVIMNRMAANEAPQQLDQIRKAKELSRQVDTGKWSAQRAGIESGLSSLIPGLSSAQNDATKLQELDKFLERIAANSTKVLGTSANTDAARESISRQNASIGYTPQAIQAVLSYAEAQTLAMQAKGKAQDTWLEKQGEGSITKQHKFEGEWREAYDPKVFQLEAADPEERKTLVSKLTKQQAATLKEKRQKLRELGAIK